MCERVAGSVIGMALAPATPDPLGALSHSETSSARPLLEIHSNNIHDSSGGLSCIFSEQSESMKLLRPLEV